MGVYVSEVRELRCALTVTRAALFRLQQLVEKQELLLAETNFLTPLFAQLQVWPKACAACQQEFATGTRFFCQNCGTPVQLIDAPDLIPITHVAWTGTWSGNGYFDSLPAVLRETRGDADLVFFWEGGGASGLQVRDGVVTECDVGYTLTPKLQAAGGSI